MFDNIQRIIALLRNDDAVTAGNTFVAALAGVSLQIFGNSPSTRPQREAWIDKIVESAKGTAIHYETKRDTPDNHSD